MRWLCLLTCSSSNLRHKHIWRASDDAADDDDDDDEEEIHAHKCWLCALVFGFFALSEHNYLCLFPKQKTFTFIFDFFYGKQTHEIAISFRDI